MHMFYPPFYHARGLSTLQHAIGPLSQNIRPPACTASRAEGPGFESRLRQDFLGVESYQWLKHWHSSGYPARRLAL